MAERNLKDKLEVTNFEIRRVFMKNVKFTVHPVMLLESFLMLLISGEAFGGFYIFYICMGLFHGAIHSIFGMIGVALTLAGYSRLLLPFWKSISSICGCTLLLLSVFVFFYNDKTNYNVQTFSLMVPMILIIIFVVIALLFLIHNFVSVYKLIACEKLAHNDPTPTKGS